MKELRSRAKRNGSSIYATILFLTLLAAFKPIYDAMTPNIFTDRDLARAADLSGTIANWIGPELSNSAMNLGPFAYLVTSLTLIPAGNDGYFWALIVFLAIGLTALFISLKKSDSANCAAIIVGLIGASPIVFTTVRMAWNPSLLPVFWVVLSLCIARQMHAVTIGLLIGLTCQIHILSIIWAPIAFLSFGKNRWKSLSWLFLGFTIPQIPAIFRASPNEVPVGAVAFSRVFDLSSWLDSSRIENMSINLLEFLGLPLLIALGFAFAKKNTSPNLRQVVILLSVLVISILFAQRSLEKRVQLHYLAPALLLLVFVIKMNWKAIDFRRPIVFGPIALLTISAFAWQALNTSNFLVHYQIPWLAFAMIFFGVLIFKWLQLKELVLPYIFMTITISIFVQAFSTDVINESRFVALTHAKELTKVVHKNTGWNQLEFEQKSLVYLRWPENSLLASYPQAGEPSNKDLQVIIVDRRLEPSIMRNPSFWTKWIQEKRLTLESEDIVGPYAIRVFKKNDTSLPSSIHNIQTPGTRTKSDTDLTERFEATFQSRILGPQRIGIEINKTVVRLTSALLSRYQTKGPQMQIIDAVLTYSCGGKTHALEIPKTGMPPFRPKGLRNPTAYIRAGMADYILAPVEWAIGDCTLPIVPRTIDVRRAHLQIWDETNSDNTKEMISNLSAIFVPAASETVPSMEDK